MYFNVPVSSITKTSTCKMFVLCVRIAHGKRGAPLAAL